MKTVTLGISSLADTKRRALSALKGIQVGEFISFESMDLLWKVMTPKRMEIMEAMTSQGPMAIREVARRVNRDVKAVHTDIKSLISAGIINKTENGCIEFPYDEIHVDFTLKGKKAA
ncbi:transcriptional regulator (plasmid) [Komagataeibacter nataicola]|uniref:Transcriptional regulator n=1 Tax=Komagataeibacter nataicola TaxID=265960 RepID=A0A9N7CK46_9PROT|nr:winged helix-turn-helix transcriptional regulator [Komagataeibacter nataicola]AQU89255.1 transcriptional regulator [Komagataeibacter nataicola]PYD66304.1 transcriptional regulator [Komagataeibacter nataicola]WNM10350.1 winged helix-turn-helix transcriptional regulator [Komagataeibacter nataicola]